MVALRCCHLATKHPTESDAVDRPFCRRKNAKCALVVSLHSQLVDGSTDSAPVVGTGTVLGGPIVIVS